MTRRQARAISTPSPQAPARSRQDLSAQAPAAWEMPALVGVVSLIIARCLFHQTLRNDDPIIPGQILAPATPGAAAALAMDAAIMALAIVVAIARVIAARAARSPVQLIGWCQGIFLALAGYMTASTAWAADKFVALVSGADLLSAACSLWLISDLVRTHRRFRLIIASALGLLLVYAAYSLNYRFVDWPATWDRWVNDIEGTRTKLLEANHWKPGDTAAQQYERNLKAGSLTGFNLSANTFAAQIILLTGLVTGLAIQRGVRRQGWWLIVPIAALIAAAWMIYYTRSRTALGMLLMMTILLLVGRQAFGWMARHRTRAFVMGVAGAVGLIAIVIGTGIVRGNLFHDSLTFRWQYWVASMHLWEAHPILGVGSANFGDFYLQYRLPVAPEEVREPHNLLVRFLAEGGILGGGLAIAFLLSLAWKLTDPKLPEADAPLAGLRDKISSKSPDLGVMLAIPIVSVLLSILIGLDFTTDTNFIIVQCSMAGIYLLMMIVGSLTGSIDSFQRQQVDGNPSPWLVRGTVIGIGLFLLQGMMDVAFFEAGPLHLLMLLAGGVLGLRQAAASQMSGIEDRADSLEPARLRLHANCLLGGLITLGILWLLWTSILVGPACAAEMLVSQGNRQLADNQPVAAAESYRHALRLMPYNGLYAYRAAEVMQIANAPSQAILAEYDKAIEAEPKNIGYLLARARFELMLDRPNHELILADYARVMELNPNDVKLRIEYAQSLQWAGQLAAARDQLKKALWYNDQLRENEIKRLPVDRVRQVQAEIARLGG